MEYEEGKIEDMKVGKAKGKKKKTYKQSVKKSQRNPDGGRKKRGNISCKGNKCDGNYNGAI